MSYMIPPPPFPRSLSVQSTIKLALKNPRHEREGPFVRISVPDQVGPDFLKQLRERAVELWKLKNDSSGYTMEEAKVQLMYRDAENDLCYIFSAEDLRGAFPLSPAALRVFARVEVPQQVAPANSNKSTSTQTSQARSFQDIPVHKVVESVLGVLTAATVALQTHVNVKPSTNTNPSAPEPARSVASSPNQRVPTEPSGTASGACPARCGKPEPAKEKSSKKLDDRPFIHGRHTCDGCLTTPIVGKRFHALNLPDYDLCESCHTNYKGTEICFEEVQLDRDACLQERWNRRFSKWQVKQTDKKHEKVEVKQQMKEERKAAKEDKRVERKKAKAEKLQELKQARQEIRCEARRSADKPPVPPPHDHVEFSQPIFPPPHCGGPPPHHHGHPRFGPPPHPFAPHPFPPPFHAPPPPCAQFAWETNGWKSSKEAQCGSPRQWNNNCLEQVDHALKEAIRRSIIEIEKDNKASDTSDESKEQAETSTESSTTTEETAKPAAKENTESTEETKENPEDEVDEASDNGEEEEEFEIPPVAPVGAPPAPRPSAEPKAKAVPAVSEESSKSSFEDTSREDSFAEDAIGSGPIAEELGKAFDKFVTDINEFKTNIDGVKVETVQSTDADGDMASSVGVVSEGKSNEGGATIVQGEEVEVDVESQEDGWDVVSDPPSNDEALALATQAVGSALFESGISGEGSQPIQSQSNMSAPDLSIGDDSGISSLPTLSTGSVHPYQAERWVLQLKALHEMGFVDDVKNIEILERFHAANIGSNEFEEVSVGRVVNELMKDF